VSTVEEHLDRTAYEAALEQCQQALGQLAAGDGTAVREYAVVALSIGMLMQAGNCDEEAAARTLARASARSDQRVELFARRLVEIQNIRSG
jgi:hypothetical protein